MSNKTCGQNEKCKSCFYRGLFYPNDMCCDYLVMTGESRGCSVENCDKYKKCDMSPDEFRMMKVRMGQETENYWGNPDL